MVVAGVADTSGCFSVAGCALVLDGAADEATSAVCVPGDACGAASCATALNEIIRTANKPLLKIVMNPRFIT
jgi:hypothetical protein